MQTPIIIFVTSVVTVLLLDRYSAHSTSTMAALTSTNQKVKASEDVCYEIQEDKRWCLANEISSLFDASLNRGFRLFEEEAEICPSQEEEHGDYNWYMLFLRFYLVSLVCNILHLVYFF